MLVSGDKDEPGVIAHEKLLNLLGLDASKVAYIENSPTQKKVGYTPKSTPMVGIEYLVEVQDIGNKQVPKTNCLLCEKCLNLGEVTSHLISASHRLRFLESFFPTVRQKFSKVPNLIHWKSPAYDFLESIALRIQTKFGRAQVLTIQGTDYFAANLEAIKAVVEYRKHCREDETLNFKSIPDPFGSFLNNIPKGGLVNVIHQEVECKPGIVLARQFQNLSDDSPAIVVDPDVIKKESVLNRISDMRKNLSNEKVDLDRMMQYKREVTKEKTHNLPNIVGRVGGASREDEDEDLPTFKIRKSTGPRGLISKNFAKKQNLSADNRPNRDSRRRDKSASRDRSISPFVVAMQNYDKFKKMEAAMLKNVTTRKELYQKRPEDHPNYAEEWKVFWKKRYGELINQGRDPNTHDFKADWIPFWEKRLLEFFDMEVLEKTDELMKKFGMSTVVPPKREDYARPEPSPPPRRKRTPSPRRRSPRKYSPSPKKHRRLSPSPGRRAPPRLRDRSRSRRSRSRSTDRSRGRRGTDRHDEIRNRHEPRSRDDEERELEMMERSLRRSNSLERSRTTRNPSPPGPRRDLGDRGRTGPSRMESQDMYSGITELEHRRDRGRSRSRSRESANKGSLARSFEYHKSDKDGSTDLSSVLRVLTAMEDSLGSLGPHVNNILAKVLSLEGKREGASRVVLEDPDSVSILDMVKEKLQGQMMAGLLTGSKEAAVRVSLDNLTRLLQGATKKRVQNPAQLLAPSSLKSDLNSNIFNDTKAVNQFIARAISTVLVATDRAHITDLGLNTLLTELMKEVAIMDEPGLAKVANDFNDALVLEAKLKQQAVQEALNPRPPAPSYRSSPASSYNRRAENNIRRDDNNIDLYDDSNIGRDGMVGTGPVYVTPTYAPVHVANAQPEIVDDADDFTPEELRSLLENFNSLSKQEQEDLIVYMKKLEATNPGKVKDLLPILRRVQGVPAAAPSSVNSARNSVKSTRDSAKSARDDDSDLDIIEDDQSKSKPKAKKKEKAMPIKFSLASGDKKEKKNLGSNVFGDAPSDSDSDKTDTKDEPNDDQDDCEVIEIDAPPSTRNDDIRRSSSYGSRLNDDPRGRPSSQSSQMNPSNPLDAMDRPSSFMDRMNSADRSNPQNPMNPYNAMDRMNPQNPMDQMDSYMDRMHPQHPMDRMNPQNSMDHMNPRNTMDRMNPQNPMAQMDPYNPLDRMNPQNPMDRMSPQNPMDRMDSYNSLDRMNPQNPMDRMNPQNPMDRMNPQNPMDRMNPQNPMNRMNYSDAMDSPMGPGMNAMNPNLTGPGGVGQGGNQGEYGGRGVMDPVGNQGGYGGGGYGGDDRSYYSGGGGGGGW